MKTIAYIAPEIPALSATFIYNELHAMERLGHAVIPISIHRPHSPAAGQEQLSEHTFYLYEKGLLTAVKASLRQLLNTPRRYLSALKIAMADATHLGPRTHSGRGIPYRFLMAGLAARELASADHIHAHFAHVPGDIAMYAALISGIPFSFTAHANDVFDHAWLLRQKSARALFTVAISKFNRDFLVQQGARADGIKVIHCGVEPDDYPPPRPANHQAPHKIHSLGRLVEKKGFVDLLEAVRILARQKIDITLVIGGDGPQLAELQDKARGLDVKFRGPLKHSQVTGWLREADLFVLACRKDSHGDMDGIPVVLMEAMLCGVTVVSTYISGVPELIEDGVSGYLAEPHNPRSLAEAIRRALDDGHTITAARQKIIANFNLRNNARLLSQTIQGGGHDR